MHYNSHHAWLDGYYLTIEQQTVACLFDTGQPGPFLVSLLLLPISLRILSRDFNPDMYECIRVACLVCVCVNYYATCMLLPSALTDHRKAKRQVNDNACTHVLVTTMLCTCRATVDIILWLWAIDQHFMPCMLAAAQN